MFIVSLIVNQSNLLSVDNLQRALGGPTADVPRVQPPILIQCLFGEFWHFVVALEYVGPFDAHFAGVVPREVVQLGNIDQLDGVAWSWDADMAGNGIALNGHLKLPLKSFPQLICVYRGSGHAFSLAVALTDDSSGGTAHESEHGLVERGRSSDLKRNIPQ